MLQQCADSISCKDVSVVADSKMKRVPASAVKSSELEELAYAPTSFLTKDVPGPHTEADSRQSKSIKESEARLLPRLKTPDGSPAFIHFERKHRRSLSLSLHSHLRASRNWRIVKSLLALYLSLVILMLWSLGKDLLF